MKRLWRLLRSRKLAVWAIVAFAAYAAVSTLFSGSDYSAPYRNPIFLALSAVLAISTGACAWERTRAAYKNARLGETSEGARRQLVQRPSFVVSASGAEDLDRAQQALRSLGLSTRASGDSVEARGGIAGAFGSPVFHWALALLFVVIMLGQLTRSEGLMGVVRGSFRPDMAASYGTLDKGPLKGDLSGRIIAVPSIEQTYVANGIDQGVTPQVEIRTADGKVLASGYAYANHPIRYRSMLVHYADYGLAAVVTVTQGGEPATSEVLLDYNQDHSNVEPNGVTLHDPSGRPLYTILFDLPPERVNGQPSVRMTLARGTDSPEGSAAERSVMVEGETTELAEGVTLRIDRLTSYARLSVVDDWSVYVIYALFALAAIGLALAVFAPLRAARVLLVTEGDVASLYVAVRHGRGDPHFAGRVERALAQALDSEEAR